MRCERRQPVGIGVPRLQCLIKQVRFLHRMQNAEQWMLSG